MVFCNTSRVGAIRKAWFPRTAHLNCKFLGGCSADCGNFAYSSRGVAKNACKKKTTNPLLNFWPLKKTLNHYAKTNSEPLTGPWWGTTGSHEPFDFHFFFPRTLWSSRIFPEPFPCFFKFKINSEPFAKPKNRFGEKRWKTRRFLRKRNIKSKVRTLRRPKFRTLADFEKLRTFSSAKGSGFFAEARKGSGKCRPLTPTSITQTHGKNSKKIAL